MSTNVGIREAKARLSQLVRRAERGEIVTITDHGRPAARLVPARELSLEERFAALERRGLLARQPDSGAPPRAIRTRSPAAAQRMLREDRDAG